jgi:hypothetical protein
VSYSSDDSIMRARKNERFRSGLAVRDDHRR